MVIIDYFKKLWNLVSKIPSDIKTLIIIILLFFIGNPIINNSYKDIINNALQEQKEELRGEEDNAFKQAPFIAQCIDNIREKDSDCSNVLLLSYHNTKHSLQGFSYIYLDCIRESVKSYQDDYVGDYWQTLQYTNYQEELKKIDDTSYLRVDSLQQIQNTFPRLYRKLKQSGAYSAAFYPIEGIRNPIGLVVILYKDTKHYDLGYYNTVIAPQIQKLSTILDDANDNEHEN